MHYMDKYNLLEDPLFDFSISTNQNNETKAIIQSCDTSNLADISMLYPIEQVRKRFLLNVTQRYHVDHVCIGAGVDYFISFINQYIHNDSCIAVCCPCFYRIYETHSRILYFYEHISRHPPYLDTCNLDKFLNLHHPKAIWITNPNSITGNTYRSSDLLNLINKYPTTMFLVDESFADFVLDESSISLLQFVERYNNIIVFRSFSKFYGLPGLRIAIAASKEETLHHYFAYAAVFPVSSASIYLTTIVLEKLDKLKLLGILNDNIQKVLDAIREKDYIHITPSMTNTIVLTGTEAFSIYDFLFHNGIHTLDLRNERGLKHCNAVRLTIPSEPRLFDYLLQKIKILPNSFSVHNN